MKLTPEEQEQIAEALNLGESQRSSGCASVNGSAADAAVDVRDALKLLNDSWIRRNEHRLGAIGAQDMERVRIYLTSALRKLPNRPDQRPGQ